LIWGYSFSNSNVHNQLAEQQIYFPPKTAFANAKPTVRTTARITTDTSRPAQHICQADTLARARTNAVIGVQNGVSPSRCGAVRAGALVQQVLVDHAVGRPRLAVQVGEARVEALAGGAPGGKVGGLPRRGRSSRPARRCSKNRLRHCETTSRLQRTRAAI
jgi:hypothetical protein